MLLALPSLLFLEPLILKLQLEVLLGLLDPKLLLMCLHLEMTVDLMLELQLTIVGAAVVANGIPIVVSIVHPS